LLECRIHFHHAQQGLGPPLLPVDENIKETLFEELEDALAIDGFVEDVSLLNQARVWADKLDIDHLAEEVGYRDRFDHFPRLRILPVEGFCLGENGTSLSGVGNLRRSGARGSPHGSKSGLWFADEHRDAIHLHWRWGLVQNSALLLRSPVSPALPPGHDIAKEYGNV
jgi:hypothetical protein